MRSGPPGWCDRQRSDPLVLDVGTPVKVNDMTGGLIKQPGKWIDVLCTDRWRRQKLREGLGGDHDGTTHISHPQISEGSAPASAVRAMLVDADHAQCALTAWSGL